VGHRISMTYIRATLKHCLADNRMTPDGARHASRHTAHLGTGLTRTAGLDPHPHSLTAGHGTGHRHQAPGLADTRHLTPTHLARYRTYTPPAHAAAHGTAGVRLALHHAACAHERAVNRSARHAVRVAVWPGLALALALAWPRA
jgi:hypothetical protein